MLVLPVHAEHHTVTTLARSVLEAQYNSVCCSYLACKTDDCICVKVSQYFVVAAVMITLERCQKALGLI